MRRFAALSLAVFAVLALAATCARAQCSISSITLSETQTVLCAAGSGSQWQWSGPNGFTSAMQCVTVSDQGLYSVRIFNDATGQWGEPCSFQLGAAVPPLQCSISGPDSVCSGASISLCGPDGAMAYQWGGPAGLLGTSACQSVTDPGLYTLQVRDASSGLWAAPCSLSVRAGCALPPPPSSSASCPLPPWGWRLACVSRAHAMPLATLEAVGAAVDARTNTFSFHDPAAEFCALEAFANGKDLRARALRQFAGVVANAVASPMNLSRASGASVGLSESTVLESVPGVPAGTTLGQWIDGADNLFSAARALREKEARNLYSQLRQQGWLINHGSGLTTDCSTTNSDDGESSAMASLESADFVDGPAAGAESASIDMVSPNPFASSTRIAWSLPKSGDVELVVVDLAGRQVRTLARGWYAAGSQTITWDGRDDAGHVLHAGAYFIHGLTGGQSFEQRLVIVR